MPGAFSPGVPAAQVRVLESAIGNLRYIGSGEVERAVRQLAEKLSRHFGGHVRGFRFTAIPRGGFVVLGILASMLDLPPERLGGVPSPAETLVVVDDCALSGGRFGSFIAEQAADRIVFAHLCSHPSLRAAILAREPRVTASIAAFDLSERSREPQAAPNRWLERLGSHRYWVGDCEPVCFPWNEPDRLIWNPVAREVELGWKIVPPQRCYKRGGVNQLSIPIQIQPQGRGPLRPSPDALFGRAGHETIVAHLRSGLTYRLTDSSHAMWWALLKAGAPESAQDLLSRQYDVAPEALRFDLEEFVNSLLEQGLIEARTSPR